MNPIYLSTGAVTGRANGNDYRMPARLNAMLPLDGWEFLMTRSFYGQEDEILRASEGLVTPVFHVNKAIGEMVSEGNMEDVPRLFTANCRLAKALGSRLLVHHLWGGLASDQHIERNIAAYPLLRDIAEEHGLTLTIENVVCNQRDPMTHMKTLAEKYPDIRFTFDTKMAAFHSQLAALYAPENAWLWPRIAHLHVNDYAGGHMDWGNMSAKAIGAGYIDFDRFFAFARQMGYRGSVTHEGTAVHPDGTINTDQLNDSLRRIRAGLAGEERI